jgi:uncharacterized repeat protein (TIGR03803 family)
MKINLKQTILIVSMWLLAALFWMTGNSDAVVFNNLYDFTDSADTDYIGINLVLSGNTLYGTRPFGGTAGEGTVFKINTDGTGFTNIYNFTATSSNNTNSDGIYPSAGLIISSNTLYGTTYYGGYFGSGTVFAVNTDGIGFTNLHNFTATSFYGSVHTNRDGANPEASLVLSGNTLYGTTRFGGTSGVGTVFAVGVDGANFTNLYNFTATSLNGSVNTNSDGANPVPNLVLSGNTLYGATSQGGTNGYGTVFKINTDGTDFSVLLTFIYAEGSNPTDLILSGNRLYGTTGNGGAAGNGVVFKINTDGTDFTNLYNFPTASSGVYPLASLALSSNTLYGIAQYGGSSGEGTVYAINIDGTSFTNLYYFATIRGAFDTNNGGALPCAGLAFSGNTLYGATSEGGSNGDGAVFALSLGPIPLNIQSISNAVVLSWGNPAFSLQAAPAATGVYTNVPDAASPYTNAITSSQMFFRLEAQ